MRDDLPKGPWASDSALSGGQSFTRGRGAYIYLLTNGFSGQDGQWHTLTRLYPRHTSSTAQVRSDWRPGQRGRWGECYVGALSVVPLLTHRMQSCCCCCCFYLLLLLYSHICCRYSSPPCFARLGWWGSTAWWCVCLCLWRPWAIEHCIHGGGMVYCLRREVLMWLVPWVWMGFRVKDGVGLPASERREHQRHGRSNTPRLQGSIGQPAHPSR